MYVTMNRFKIKPEFADAYIQPASRQKITQSPETK